MYHTANFLITFSGPDHFLCGNCCRLSCNRQMQACSLWAGPHHRCCMDCWWACVCRIVPPEPSIDDTHMTGLHKAASPQYRNTCSAAQQVNFYNSTKNKSVLQRYCFQPLCSDWDGGVFYWVVFMENLAVIDIIKGLCLTLSPVQRWPAASEATCWVFY